MIKKHLISFGNAIHGLMWIVSTQRNFKIHLALSLIAITAGFFLGISYLEFLTIVLLIAIGLSIEAVNTAIEETIDALHKDFSPEIKIAKDVSAAAMLIFSIGAFVTAFIIFVPRLISLFTYSH